MRLEFNVPGVPMAQPRGRPVRVGNGSVRVVVPREHASHDYKAAVRLAAAKAMELHGVPMFTEPVSCYLIFVFPRPKSKCWKTKPMEMEPLARKPDLDNLQKSVFDALNGVLWPDDSLVALVNAEKLLSSNPHDGGMTEVSVMPHPFLT